MITAAGFSRIFMGPTGPPRIWRFISRGMKARIWPVASRYLDKSARFATDRTAPANPGRVLRLLALNLRWAIRSASSAFRFYGLSGTVQVKGQAYVGLSMGAMGATLSSEDLAAVLSYIRNSWGNKAEPVTAAQVDAVRKEVGNRSPFTVDELNAVK